MFNLLEAHSTTERLSELGRFLEYWYGPRRSEYGISEDELPPLPEPLRWFYTFAGRWPPVRLGHGIEYFYTGAGGHYLHPLDSVTARQDGRIEFFTEYQGDWIALTLQDGEDPPVWIEGYWYDPTEDESDEEEDEEDEEDEEIPSKVKQVSDSLSRFLVTHCLMSTIYEDANSPSPSSGSDRESRILAEWFRTDASEAKQIWQAEPDGCPNYDGTFYLFYQHILVHRTDQDWHKFGTHHPQGVERLREILRSSI